MIHNVVIIYTAVFSIFFYDIISLCTNKNNRFVLHLNLRVCVFIFYLFALNVSNTFSYLYTRVYTYVNISFILL